MNGALFRNSKDLRKPSGGCVGIPANMYDLNSGIGRTKHLTDRDHRDGSPVQLCRADAKKMNDTSVAKKDDKKITSYSKNNISSKKSGGTPVKVLMELEMSKEEKFKRKGPSVVARLMGLDDSPPAQQPVTVSGRTNLIGGYPVGALGGPWQQNAGLFNKVVPFDISQDHTKEMEFKDVYEEVRRQPSGTKVRKDPHGSEGSCAENRSEKRMALVREKFIEAKRLATDQNLLQSKEFQDAIEVLSSNRDLFLKFLEEPNSLFSKQINGPNAIHVPPQTRCITVLKPSKAADLKNERLVSNQCRMDERRGWDTNTYSRSSSFSHLKTENFVQSTRIVVLKPNSAKVYNTEAQVIPEIGYCEILKKNEFDGDYGDIVGQGSENMSKPISHQMQESSAFHRRDESLLSSICSNGYGGDSSSYCRSDREYTEDDGGCFSDSEIATPISRHSWDSANKYCSTFSASSLSRTHSPASSVTREAKKRLSERWALMAGNEINREEIPLQKSSSTLGAVLAVPEVKKEEYSDCHIHAISKSCGGENELIPVSCLSKDGGVENSPRSLSRSKSVPISSTIYEKLDLSTEGSGSKVSKTNVSKEVPKSKKEKSSLKGKFSNFFFSRNKKTDKEKQTSCAMPSYDVDIQSSSVMPTISNKPPVDANMPLEINREEESEGAALQLISMDLSENKSSFRKSALSIDETRTISDLSDMGAQGSYGSLNYKLDQTSPTSVLDATIDYKGNKHDLHSSEADSGQPCDLSQSLPIVSVSRTLSWENEHLNASSSSEPQSSSKLSMANYDIEKQLAWVEKLFSSAGLDKCGILFAGWHSLDSPLNPMLLEKLLDLEEDAEKCKAKRSSHRLLFDSANSAILEVGQKYLTACPRNRTYSRPNEEPQAGDAASREVWNLLNDWFTVIAMPAASPETNNATEVVERALRQEVQGQRWNASMKLELQEIFKEIGSDVLKQLLDEALADLTV